jgi:hypothetical protein
MTTTALSSLHEVTELCFASKNSQQFKTNLKRLVKMGEEFQEDGDFVMEYGKAILKIKYEKRIESSLECAIGQTLSNMLKTHIDNAVVTKSLCSSIEDMVKEYDGCWQEAIGRSGGCAAVASVLRNYIAQPEMLNVILSMMAWMVADEDGFLPKNRIRFRKAGVCELIVQILERYKQNTKLIDLTYCLVNGIAANSDYNKKLFEKYEIFCDFDIPSGSEVESDGESGVTSEEEQ